VIAAPGGRAGVVAPQTVELVDVMPTVCDLAGVPLPAGTDGRSLAPLVRVGQAAGFPDRPAITEVVVRDGSATGSRGVSMRSGKWRYTEWNNGAAGRQLYDHDTDPQELVNLADRPEQATTVAALGKELRRLTDIPEESP